MPYKIVGKNLMHMKSGKWSVKQHCSSVANAKKAMSLLRGLEYGAIEKSEVSKRINKKNN